MIPTFFVLIVVALFWAYQTLRLISENRSLRGENNSLKEIVLDYKLNSRPSNSLDY